MKDQTYTPRHDDKTGWKSRHLTAVAEPLGSIYGPEKPTHERAMVLMLRGWLEYAEAQKSAFDSNIGDDYVLGDEWFKIGEALRGLLNGDLGRLDGGTLDTIIADNLNEQGFDPDLGERKQHGNG
jgi:hypothetical protein